MSTQVYQIRQCTNEACTLRFPMPAEGLPGELCPRCGAQTALMAELTVDPEHPTAITRQAGAGQRDAVQSGWPPLEGVLDNVRSLFNTGSIFRSADGAGWQRLHLCGITPTPENPKLAKTALGATHSVNWTYHSNGVTAIHKLRAAGFALWALEEQPQATSIFTIPLPDHPLALVVGNEVTGVDPAILSRCDNIVAIPMYGRKRSLNVATAFGVAAAVLAQRCQESRQKRLTMAPKD